MPFLGMRGTGDWPANYRPENFRETILRLYPNGKAPLTAIMSMLKSSSTNDPHFHWFEKQLVDRSAAPTGVYSGEGLGGGAYAPAGAGTAVANDLLSFKMAAVDAPKFKVGAQVLLKDADDSSLDCNAKVKTVVVNGANSYITVILLEDDDNGGLTNNLKNVDTIFVIGNVNPEGGSAPSGQRFDATDYVNYTQIFRNALENTRTAAKTKLRTGDDVKEAKREALELHSIEMEMAFWFGVKSLRVGANDKPERTTAGIKSFIKTNKWDVLKQPGSWTWKNGGSDFLDMVMEEIFRYGSTNKIGFCGSGVLTAVDQLIKNAGSTQYNLAFAEKSYGIEVVDLTSPHGKLSLKTHPLFSQQLTLRNSLAVVDMDNLEYRYVDDTKYKPNIQANDLDGEKSEYLTEAGLEVHFEQTHAWIDNFGKDNP